MPTKIWPLLVQPGGPPKNTFFYLSVNSSPLLLFSVSWFSFCMAWYEKKVKKPQLILIQDAHMCTMGLIGLCQHGKYVENMATEETLSDTKQKIWKLTHNVLWCKSILQCHLQIIHDDKQWQGHQVCFNIWILDKKKPKKPSAFICNV